jgi:hypothetical protein
VTAPAPLAEAVVITMTGDGPRIQRLTVDTAVQLLRSLP